MKLDRRITIGENEDTIRKCIDAYLNKAGYKQVSVQPDLIYERGSLLGSLISFSPKGWQAKASIQVKPTSDQATEVLVIVDVNTTGQMVTEKERNFWNSELDGLETAIHAGTMDAIVIVGAERSSLIQNLVVTVVIIGLVIGLAVVAHMILETRQALFLGGGIGLAVGFVIAKKWLKF
jgi:hypothetical protein